MRAVAARFLAAAAEPNRSGKEQARAPGARLVRVPRPRVAQSHAGRLGALPWREAAEMSRDQRAAWEGSGTRRHRHSAGSNSDAVNADSRQATAAHRGAPPTIDRTSRSWHHLFSAEARPLIVSAEGGQTAEKGAATAGNCQLQTAERTGYAVWRGVESEAIVRGLNPVPCAVRP
jgi:hypothetical protein